MNKKLLIYFICILVLATSFILPVNACENLNNENLLDTFDWRDVNGKNYITSVKNQGNCGSCCTFAALAALEAVVQIEYDTIFECDLSEAHLYFCLGASCAHGVGIPNTVDFLKNNGVSDERCFPYESKDMDCDEKADNWRQRLFTVNTINIVWGSIDIKEALVKYGPVITYMITYDDFKSYTGGIYEHEWGSKTSSTHAVTIVGYNDDLGYWIGKNSWGKGWGEDGYFRIKYGECEIDDEAYYFDGVGGNIQPCKPTDIYPNDNADDIDLDITISWESGDVNGDIVTYSVFFNEGQYTTENNDPIVSGLTDKFFQLEDLKKDTYYSFRILAKDEHGSQHISDDITFNTRLPLPPVIDGPRESNLRKECTYSAYSTDVDGEVYYWFFDWGDIEDSGWLGPYGPHDHVSATHSWHEEGDYNISVRYNQDGLLSDWGTLGVSMLKTKVYNPIQLLLRMLERFPFMVKILNQIII